MAATDVKDEELVMSQLSCVGQWKVRSEVCCEHPDSCRQGAEAPGLMEPKLAADHDGQEVVQSGLQTFSRESGGDKSTNGHAPGGDVCLCGQLLSCAGYG